jgi:hypothetical protein
MAVEAFGIEKEFLHSLLDEAAGGKAQLPEFQRGWVWPLENIRSLLASISLGYPVGTVMMLRTGGEVRFKQRPIEGGTTTGNAERLILDGQQRLTSLFQALRLGRAIETQDARKRRVSGWFYINIGRALDPNIDREEAFVFIPADKRVKNFRGEVEADYSSAELEYATHMFPMTKVFDPFEWFQEYSEHWDYAKDLLKQKDRFHREVISQFDKYQVPVIELGSSTPREAVCQVFEKVNTGGVTLTVFELLTATYAADEFDLRRDWEDRRRSWGAREYRVLHEVANTDFLQAITLLQTREARERYLASNPEDDRAPRIGCRRVDILKLPLDAYRRWAGPLTEGFKAAARLLHEQYMFDTKFLPYGTQLIPLSAILTVLTSQEANTVGARQKLARWLGCGVFGELYGGTTETRFARDLPDVVAWIRGTGTDPRTVQEAQFAPGRLDTLRTRGSAAYKGLYALLMKNQASDWRSGEQINVASYFDLAIDIHHIFPKAWCEKNGIEPADYNTILNKTPLTAQTNRIIQGRAPSLYLPSLARDAGVTQRTIEAHVATHAADPAFMLKDDFDGFLADRRNRLLRLISEAMGKPVEGTLGDGVIEPAETDEDLDDE